MASRPQLECIIGESGAGKTLYVVAIKLVEFLKNESGDFWHNLPVRPEGVAALVGKPVEEIEPRLKLIPAEELKTWVDGKGGPWSFFADKEIKGAHIAIDEAHRYFGKKHSKPHLAALGEWSGGLRHHGATAALITQHEFKLSTDARNEAGVQTRIFSPSQRKEAFSGAKWYDVLQLLSKFRKRKIGLTIVREGVQQGRTARDFASDGFRYIFHRPEYYAAYDSFNNIQAEGADDGADNRPKEEWERFSWPRLLLWYLERNFIPTAIRALLVGFVVWLFALGGLSWTVESVFAAASSSMDVMSGQPEQGKAVSGKGKSAQAGEPQPTLADPRDIQLQQLAEVNRTMAMKLQEAAVYAEEITGLVAVVGDTCYWADGSSGQVGSVVETGPFAGKMVDSIDPKKGVVRLAGGIALRVGVLSPDQSQRLRSWREGAALGGPQSPAAGAPGSGTNSPVNLRGGSPALAPIPVLGSRPAKGDSPVLGNSGPDVLQHPRRSIRRLRGGGTGFGPINGDGGVSGDPASDLPRDSGPASRGGTGGIEGPVLPRNSTSGGQGSDGPQVPASE